ncbi:uncharacterized protein EV154DRAFT_412403, partial [Mucor mucedo]|uniref:uncharacterized protein n=1 Tax=Mucor mucedo TaxID=29922 RepID=UPI00221E9CBC
IDCKTLNGIFFISSKHNRNAGIEDKYKVEEGVDMNKLDQFKVEKLRKNLLGNLL